MRLYIFRSWQTWRRTSWCHARAVVSQEFGLPIVGSEPAAFDGDVVLESNRGGGDQSGHSDQSGRHSDQARRLAADIDVPEDSPFVISEGLLPVPGKLVKKILKGDFVDMAELLRDNLEADRQVPGREAKNTDGSTSRLASRREVPDLLSWVQCFGVYVCVVASRHPSRIRRLLAYQTLIVREARRLGGRGWQAYDSLFRQQAAVSNSMDWSKLNSSLYALTFLAQQGVRSCHSNVRYQPPHGNVTNLYTRILEAWNTSQVLPQICSHFVICMRTSSNHHGVFNLPEQTATSQLEMPYI